jgi:RimJ/RimL family protein N-acetyltransferase
MPGAANPVARPGSPVENPRVPAPVVLRGRDVRLEPLTEAHIPPLLQAASLDRSTYGYTPVPVTAVEMAAYVRDALEAQAAGAELPFATVALAAGEERVVGSTRFLDIECWPGRGGDGPTVVEIGATWLASTAQRTPVNTEAKLLMLTHAFEAWGVLRVSLKTDARNERSRRAIERIGAQFEGVRRAHKPATDGGVRDSAYYSIVAVEWPAVRDALLARLDQRR